MPPRPSAQLQHPPSPQAAQQDGPYLAEVVEGFVQVGMHPRGRLVGDFDGVLQDALRNDVALWAWSWLCADEDTEIPMAALTVLLQLLLQRAQPLGHQMDVLAGTKKAPLN